MQAHPSTRTLPAVREWRLHLGAHKTATTHLQETLRLVRPALAERGVDVIPNAEIRPLVPQLVPPRRSWRHWVTGPWTARRMAGVLDGLRLGPDVVMLSEENFLGHTSDILHPRPYPRLGSRLRVLASLGREAEITLFFSIRRMDHLLASAYAEALRFFPFREPFEAMAPRLAAAPPRWTEVLGRIRQAMPGATLTVWRYEDYDAHKPEILARLCGTDPGDLPDVPRPPQTQTPSSGAVLAAERVPRDLGYDARVAEIARIYAAAPKSDAAPAFQPFDAAATARFATAYEADCARLAAEGRLLRF